MRKVVLNENDFAMFNNELRHEDFEFYQRHKDAFRRMWTEQGKHYWVRFVMTFRSFTVKRGIIKEFPGKPEKYDMFVDQAFIYIHEQFVEAKFNCARKFVLDIFILASNRHLLQYMESKSYAKDPFYNKETREVFRSFFGPAVEKSSYIKVYFLLPIYTRIVGSIFTCLRRWLDAVDIGAGEDETIWWKPPNPNSSMDNSSRKRNAIREKLMSDVYSVKVLPPSEEMIERWWNLEAQAGQSVGPLYVPFWNYGDPRRTDQDNPLYDPDSEIVTSQPDWRTSVDFKKYKNFVLYAHRYLNPVNETQADLYHLAHSGVAIFYPPLPGHEDVKYDRLQLQAVESFKEALGKHAQGDWAHGLPRAAHINREGGKQEVVLFGYKLNPNAKISIKGTVLDSFAINNKVTLSAGLCAHGTTGSCMHGNPGSCTRGTTLTPVVLSPDDGATGNGKKRRRRKNKAGATAPNSAADGNGNLTSTSTAAKPSLKMVSSQGNKRTTVTIQNSQQTMTIQKKDGATNNTKYVARETESSSGIPELIDSFVSMTSSDETTKVQFSEETKQLTITRQKKGDTSEDEDAAGGGDPQCLGDKAMKQLATKVQQLDILDQIEKQNNHQVQIVTDADEIAKKTKCKKDSVNFRFTFNTDTSRADEDTLSETKKTFTQEVATIVKSNMSDPPSLPRGVENMVRQECRKTNVRDRLRKKHKMRKQQSPGPSLDSLDEGPSSGDERTFVETPRNSSPSKEKCTKGTGPITVIECTSVAPSRTPVTPPTIQVMHVAPNKRGSHLTGIQEQAAEDRCLKQEIAESQEKLNQLQKQRNYKLQSILLAELEDAQTDSKRRDIIQKLQLIDDDFSAVQLPEQTVMFRGSSGTNVNVVKAQDSKPVQKTSIKISANPHVQHSPSTVQSKTLTVQSGGSKGTKSQPKEAVNAGDSAVKDSENSVPKPVEDKGATAAPKPAPSNSGQTNVSVKIQKNGNGAEISGKTEGTESQGSSAQKRGTKITMQVKTKEKHTPTEEDIKRLQQKLYSDETYVKRINEFMGRLSPQQQQALMAGHNGPGVKVVVATNKTPAQMSRERGASSGATRDAGGGGGKNGGPEGNGKQRQSESTGMDRVPVEKKAKTSKKERGPGEISQQAKPDAAGKNGVPVDNGKEGEPEESPKKRRLRLCANCAEVEPEPRTFKKCQRCKVEGVKKARYYCGRDCQVVDWTGRHKREHQEDLLS